MMWRCSFCSGLLAAGDVLLRAGLSATCWFQCAEGGVSDGVCGVRGLDCIKEVDIANVASPIRSWVCFKALSSAFWPSMSWLFEARGDHIWTKPKNSASLWPSGQTWNYDFWICHTTPSGPERLLSVEILKETSVTQCKIFLERNHPLTHFAIRISLEKPHI